VSERPWWADYALRPALLVVALLVIAPAITISDVREGQSISHGLGRAARISGAFAIMVGLALLAIMTIGISFAMIGASFSILYIIVGVFAQHRARQTRSHWVVGRPALAYLGPAIAGIVTVVVLWNTTLKAPAWTFDRLRAGSELEHLFNLEELVFKDSGHYTAAPNMSRVDTFAVRQPTVSLTPDGFILRARHKRLSFDCVVYIGSTPPSDVDQVNWWLPERHPQPRLEPGHVGCFRGAEQSGEQRRQLSGLLLALVPAALGVWLSFAKDARSGKTP
jgi:hypothetical protein